MKTSYERVLECVRRRNAIEINKKLGDEIKAKFASKHEAQSAYFDSIRFRGVDAVCVDTRLTVWFDED